MSETRTTPAVENKGFVYESLGRTNAQIRSDRGDAIAEDLELSFKRDVEDSKRKVSRLEKERKGMYDFSPTNALSLVLSTSVNADEILQKDKAITIAIRNAKIELELAEERYLELFNKVVTN
jgi:hypothetical protein